MSEKLRVRYDIFVFVFHRPTPIDLVRRVLLISLKKWKAGAYETMLFSSLPFPL